MDEERLVAVVKHYMDTCRAGDWNHALRVVEWVKRLGGGRADLDLLIVAAYIHDIGWSGILPEGKVALQEMLKLENEANQNTTRLVKEVLKKLEFSEEDTQTVIRLIAAADKHDSEQDDEAIIVDADSLSKLCVEHVQEKYRPDSYRGIIELWEREFPNRLKTEKGKALYPELLDKLKKQLL